jgi:hypothetical protein
VSLIVIDLDNFKQGNDVQDPRPSSSESLEAELLDGSGNSFCRLGRA